MAEAATQASPARLAVLAGDRRSNAVDAEKAPEPAASQAVRWIAMERSGSRAPAISRWQRMRPGLPVDLTTHVPIRRYDLLAKMDRWSSSEAGAVPALRGPAGCPARLDGGLYLRPISGCGSSRAAARPHCYVAEELAATTHGSRACFPQRSTVRHAGRPAGRHGTAAHVGNEEAISQHQIITIRSSRRRADCFSRVHLRASVPRQRVAPILSATADSLHRRVQRIRAVDAAQRSNTARCSTDCT